jgi:hypothetical protein
MMNFVTSRIQYHNQEQERHRNYYRESLSRLTIDSTSDITPINYYFPD